MGCSLEESLLLAWQMAALTSPNDPESRSYPLPAESPEATQVGYDLDCEELPAAINIQPKVPDQFLVIFNLTINIENINTAVLCHSTKQR